MLRRVFVIVAALGVAASAVTLARSGRAPTTVPGPGLSETQVRDLDITFYQARIARDPLGARDRAQLAGLYLQRARETGDNQDLIRAEETARGSLANRRARNGKALAVLVNSLLAQHRYPEALASARELAALEPDARTVQALLGKGANVRKTDFTGRDALGWASESRKPAIVQLLQRAAAKR